MGLFHKYMFLIVVDAYSKWPEVINMKKDITSRKMRKVLDTLFSRFGPPNMIVSNNEPQLTSDEFKAFLKYYKIKHIRITPYHPASNGAAENFVRTIKDKLNQMISEEHSFFHSDFVLNRFLSDYRNTVHCTTNRKPSELMFKREIRIRYDLLKPNLRDTIERQLFNQTRFKQGNKKCELLKGETVYVNDYHRNTSDKIEAVIVGQTSPVMYAIKFNNGYDGYETPQESDCKNKD